MKLFCLFVLGCMIGSTMRLKSSVPPRLSVPLRLSLCIVLITGGLLTISAYSLTQRHVMRQTEARFVSITDSYARQLTQRMESYGDLLYGTRGLFAAGEINAANWEQFITAQYTFDRYPGIKVIAYAEVVPPPQKDRYVARVAAELKDSHFAIHPLSNDQDQTVVTYLQEDPHRPEYKKALGFDMSSEPLRHAALEEARASKGLVATPPLQLAETKKPGFLLILPLATAAGTRGYSVAAFETAGLIDRIMGQELSAHHTSVTLTDITGPKELSLYNKSASSNERMLTRDIVLQVADRKWQVAFQTPEHTVQTATDRWAAPGVLIGGVLLILSAAVGISWLGLRRRLRLSITS